ncbi:putative uncharacterized protein DDB_G0281251 [Drosophila albomicans]|uniref:Ubiquitin-like domain-containing protein n=1 Tax=Drosophila albomicans TaxID=7291 RepID=A0A6P8XXF0_DROAB|nr:putative uncharacterized protein DDB_G0281251 [Drosophila albomicans]
MLSTSSTSLPTGRKPVIIDSRESREDIIHNENMIVSSTTTTAIVPIPSKQQNQILCHKQQQQQQQQRSNKLSSTLSDSLIIDASSSSSSDMSNASTAAAATTTTTRSLLTHHSHNHHHHHHHPSSLTTCIKSPPIIATVHHQQQQQQQQQRQQQQQQYGLQIASENSSKNNKEWRERQQNTSLALETPTSSLCCSTAMKASGNPLILQKMTRTIPSDKINLRLILVSGKTKEFLFNPSDSAGDIAQTVFENWPTDWSQEAVTKAEILRLIYQGRFLHCNVTLGALGLPLGKTTVMHLVPRDNLPEPNSQDQRQKSKGGSGRCCSTSCCIL